MNSGVAVASLAGKIIKSVQRGVISLDATTQNSTIAAVNVNKAVIIPLGVYTDYSGNYGYYYTGAAYHSAKLILTNSTTVTAQRNKSNQGTLVVGYEVIEFA